MEISLLQTSIEARTPSSPKGQAVFANRARSHHRNKCSFIGKSQRKSFLDCVLSLIETASIVRLCDCLLRTRHSPTPVQPRDGAARTWRVLTDRKLGAGRAAWGGLRFDSDGRIAIMAECRNALCSSARTHSRAQSRVDFLEERNSGEWLRQEYAFRYQASLQSNQIAGVSRHK